MSACSPRFLIGSQAAMQLLLGWLADRASGHKANLTVSGFALALAAMRGAGRVRSWAA